MSITDHTNFGSLMEAHAGNAVQLGECASEASFLQTASSRTTKRDRDHTAIVLDEVGWLSPNYARPTVNMESYDSSPRLMNHLREAEEAFNGAGGVEVKHKSSSNNGPSTTHSIGHGSSNSRRRQGVTTRIDGLRRAAWNP